MKTTLPIAALILCMSSFALAQQTSITQYEYDANGNRTKITDPKNNVTNESYDDLNRLVETRLPTLPAGRAKIKYRYDGQDRTTVVTDPKSLATTYAYDALDQVTKQVSPDTGTTENSYDEAGNLRSTTDARGKETKYAYDALNRLTKITYADASTVRLIYDSGDSAKGRLTQISDASGQTSWTYVPPGRIATKTQKIGNRSFVVNYGYDAAGRLAEITYPSGLKVIQAYDAVGRIATQHLQGSGAPTLLYEIVSYQPFGEPTTVRYGNNQLRTQSYDYDGRLVSYTRGTEYRILKYDAAGRIVKMGPTQQSKSQIFSYDDNDHLTGWNNPITGTTHSYAYDLSGDRTQVTLGTNTYAYATSAASHRLESVSGPTAKTNTYDAAGNLVNDGTTAFTYDDRGRLLTAVRAGITTTYAVNGLDQRVKKSSGSSSRYFVYDEEGMLLGEYDNAGPVQEYVWLNGQLTAVLKGTPSAPQVYSVESDHLGTPRQVRDSARNLRWEWESDPFGVTPPNQDPAGLGVFALNLRFPGQYFDQETGLHYNYFRDYDPIIGRYIQSDPIGLKGGINTYAYVGSNPISYVDPKGLQRGPMTFNPPVTPQGTWIPPSLGTISPGPQGAVGYNRKKIIPGLCAYRGKVQDIASELERLKVGMTGCSKTVLVCARIRNYFGTDCTSEAFVVDGTSVATRPDSGSSDYLTCESVTLFSDKEECLCRR